jgi:hypothetical protein
MTQTETSLAVLRQRVTRLEQLVENGYQADHPDKAPPPVPESANLHGQMKLVITGLTGAESLIRRLSDRIYGEGDYLTCRAEWSDLREAIAIAQKLEREMALLLSVEPKE